MIVFNRVLSEHFVVSTPFTMQLQTIRDGAQKATAVKLNTRRSFFFLKFILKKNPIINLSLGK